jgi:ADP-heptose:LPS heptosyltransferase
MQLLTPMTRYGFLPSRRKNVSNTGESGAARQLGQARILICRTDNIGDVVLTLPLAGYIKQRWPGATVHFVCRRYAAPVVQQCSNVDQVLTFDNEDDAAPIFAHRPYDIVIFAYPERRLAKAARRAGVPERVGTSHRLYHLITCNRLAHFNRSKSSLHEAQLNFELLRPLGIDYAPSLAEIPALYGLRAPYLAAAETLRAEAQFNLILHPKSNGNGREWPLAHYETLARQLQAVPGVAIWVTGSAAEGAILRREAPGLFELPHVRHLYGTVDLAGLTAMIGAADGLVASGTGPLHVAAALGRPALGLFPPIQPIDIARWGALGARAQSLSAPSRCGTCTGNASCTCMAAIGVDAVAAIVLGWRSSQLQACPAP